MEINERNEPQPDPLFNVAQLRRVKIVLRRFEEDLRQALGWLDGDQGEGYLYRRSLMLPQESRQRARERILTGLEEIHHLAERLSLEVEIENASRSLASQLSIDWADLIELHAGKLKIFGEVHPEASRVLDGSVDRMAQIALDLSTLFIRTPTDPSADLNPTDHQEKEI